MCVPGSDSVGDAYRCFSGNGIHDPCWADDGSPSTPTVVCQQEPWDTSVTQFTVPSGLEPFDQNLPIDRNYPWGVQLTDGERCIALQGAHDNYDGSVVDYMRAERQPVPAAPTALERPACQLRQRLLQHRQQPVQRRPQRDGRNRLVRDTGHRPAAARGQLLALPRLRRRRPTALHRRRHHLRGRKPAHLPGRASAGLLPHLRRRLFDKRIHLPPRPGGPAPARIPNRLCPRRRKDRVQPPGLTATPPRPCDHQLRTSEVIELSRTSRLGGMSLRATVAFAIGVKGSSISVQ